MSLIPVQFRKSEFLQSIQIANRGVDRNRFDIVYLINDLEIHDRKRIRCSGLFGSTVPA